MKKTFRVATAFTGAAACTAAFVPPAAATPGATAQEAQPNIVVKHCDSTTKQWVHLYYTPAEKHGPACFGFTGLHFIGRNTAFSKICTGNNHGYIRYAFSAAGPSTSTDFSPRETLTFLPNPLYIYSVGISGWDNSGYTCPQ